MNGPTDAPDPNALTQPIPIVSPPPRPARSIPIDAVVARPAMGETPVPSPTVVAPPYVHRFGSIPFYLFARFAAFVVDIFGIAFLIATFGYHLTSVGTFVVAGHDPNGYATLVELSLGIALGFAFLCESIFGTTLGKTIFALHVRRGNGRHAGALRVFARYLLRPIDLLLIGPLLALVTPRHQRVGDFLAGTVVSRSRIGAFASVLGVLLLVGAIYAQAIYGGGLTSAVGVTAETADYGPGLVARVTSLFGVPGTAPADVAPQTGASGAPAVATPAPIPSSAIQ